jgi:hypothetical protein
VCEQLADEGVKGWAVQGKRPKRAFRGPSV